MEWICKRKDQEKEARRELHGTNGSMVTWKRKVGEGNMMRKVGERNVERKVQERGT